METIKIRDLGFKNKIAENKIKHNSNVLTEEEILKIVFISYYGICIDNIDYFNIFNPSLDETNSKDGILFKTTGIITEEKMNEILYLLYLEDEEIKKCLEVLKTSELFIKNEIGYILNADKFEKEKKILKEIFIFNGYIDGVAFSGILKQLKLSFSISLEETLICLYIAKFSDYLTKKDDKYYLDNSKLSIEQLQIMKRIVNNKKRQKLINMLSLLKERLNEFKWHDNIATAKSKRLNNSSNVKI